MHLIEWLNEANQIHTKAAPKRGAAAAKVSNHSDSEADRKPPFVSWKVSKIIEHNASACSDFAPFLAVVILTPQRRSISDAWSARCFTLIRTTHTLIAIFHVHPTAQMNQLQTHSTACVSIVCLIGRGKLYCPRNSYCLMPSHESCSMTSRR